MKIKFLFAMLLIVSCVSGCQNKTSIKHETDAEIEGISRENQLNKYNAFYTDVEYKFGKEVYGQSMSIDIKKADFNNVPNVDFVEFVKKSSKMNDNIIFIFEDNTAIIFTNAYEDGTYGNWDSNTGITNIIGKYNLDENNKYKYTELSSKQ
jgi:hypothetical protein